MRSLSIVLVFILSLAGCYSDTFEKRDSLRAVLYDTMQARRDRSMHAPPPPPDMAMPAPDVVDPDPSAPADPDETFAFVEEMPEFPGGSSALNRFLVKNIQYPDDAKNAGIQGTVYVSFVVEKDGSITNIALAKGVSASLDNEAMRVFRRMPKWKPGKMNGITVRTTITQPIKFKLQ